MISSDKLCMSCMREIGDARKCPHCGYYADSTQISPYLPVRTVVANRYMVGKMLEYNGEGATYIGWDLVEKKAIKIREFIPDSFTIRSTSNLTLQVMRGSEAVFKDLRRSFEEMWSKLARLKGLSALISVNDVVEDYGTSYAVYDHFEGITLRDFLLRSNTGYITWERARQLLMPVLSALGTLHSSAIIHRGISPSTLVIGTDGKIKITGFCVGAARTSRSDLNSQLYDGYAAIEQYGFDGQQGTWTDIYAFAAVLYRTLIGSDPISSKERMTNDRLMVPGKFAEALPAYVINGLINALQILPDDRTRTVEQLRAELSASPVATAVSGQHQRTARTNAPQSRPAAPVLPKKKKKKMSAIALMFLSFTITLLVGLSSLAIYMVVSKDETTAPKSSNAADDVEKISVDSSSFIGREMTEFRRQFGTDFTIEIIESSHDTAKKGEILDIYPPSGEYQKGTKFTLTVSSGKERNPIPENLKNQKYKDVVAALEESGFICKREPTKTSDSNKDEVVFDIIPNGNPDKNDLYVKGTEVVIRVYTFDGEYLLNENGERVTDANGDFVYKPSDDKTTTPVTQAPSNAVTEPSTRPSSGNEDEPVTKPEESTTEPSSTPDADEGENNGNENGNQNQENDSGNEALDNPPAEEVTEEHVEQQ